MEKKNMPIAIRHAVEGDLSFIFNSWLKSFRTGLLCKHVENPFYFTGQHKIIERLLRRCTTLVAVSPTDPADIYGYVVFERIEGIMVVQYAYTKQTFRCIGVLRQLLKSVDHDWNTAAIYTHNTFNAGAIARRYNLAYNPYILMTYTAAEAEASKPESDEAD